MLEAPRTVPFQFQIQQTRARLFFPSPNQRRLPWWLSGKDIHLPIQEMWVQFLGQEDPQEKEMATLQYSYLENSIDRAAWQTTVLGIAKESDTTQ